jgi:hypothetical protein
LSSADDKKNKIKGNIMKLFKLKNERTTKEMRSENGDIIFPSKTIYEMEMINETIVFILDDTKNYNTMILIRKLILNIYNSSRFEAIDIFGLIRNADVDHQELVMDIIGIAQSKYGQSCFLIIDELAPRIIKTFGEQL